jgi:hypothetical protein
MQITRNNLDTSAGPSDWFTGSVYIDTVAAPTREQRPLRPNLPRGSSRNGPKRVLREPIRARTRGAAVGDLKRGC